MSRLKAALLGATSGVNTAPDFLAGFESPPSDRWNPELPPEANRRADAAERNATRIINLFDGRGSNEALDAIMIVLALICQRIEKQGEHKKEEVLQDLFERAKEVLDGGVDLVLPGVEVGGPPPKPLKATKVDNAADFENLPDEVQRVSLMTAQLVDVIKEAMGHYKPDFDISRLHQRNSIRMAFMNLLAQAIRIEPEESERQFRLREVIEGLSRIGTTDPADFQSVAAH